MVRLVKGFSVSCAWGHVNLPWGGGAAHVRSGTLSCHGV